MNKNLSRSLKIALPLALGLFLVWYSYSKFTQEQLREIARYFKKADYGWVLLATALSVLSHLLRAWRWNYMLQPLGHRARLANNFMFISIAYLMNIPIPKSGEVIRGLLLDKYEGVPFKKGFGTIISERTVDLVLLLAFTLVALSLQFEALYGYLTGIVSSKKILAVGTGLAVLAALLVIFMKYRLPFGLARKLQIKARNFLLGVKDGMLSIYTMEHKGLFVAHTLFIWGLYLLSFYVATMALPETSGISIGAIIITFVVGSFSFAFTNSGFGSYPFFVAGILAVFGVAQTAGTAFGWIVWASNIASILLLGGLSFIVLPFYNRGRRVSK